MLLSDSPSGHTGLGRITRDLALRIHEHMSDVFEVATYGYGTPPSSDLPFKQYSMRAKDLVPDNLPYCWLDFAGKEKGILFAAWNVSWLGWLSDTPRFARGELAEFLSTNPFKRWAYLPIDADVRPGRLALNLAEATSGFDRVLHYTKFGKSITDQALMDVGHPLRDSEYLPHGIDRTVFYKRDRDEARATLFERVTGGERNPIKNDVVLVGVCATNNFRKDWALAFETCEQLVKDGVNVCLWIHIDHQRSNWDLIALIREFNMAERVLFSTKALSDEDMAWSYSACDVTLGIAPEGYGYSPLEAISCGIPTVVGDYAASGEFFPEWFKVKPKAFCYSGFFNARRPVYDPTEFANAVQASIGATVSLPEYLDWVNLWPRWSKWLLDGVK
jgi:glycosyltransferase involved in cell wall biosynthesis